MAAKKKPTSKKATVKAFSKELFPWAHTHDFCLISTPMGDMSVYGVFNKLTGHIELLFSQVSAAVINMQTAQQTFDRVRTGEANGYFSEPSGGTG